MMYYVGDGSRYFPGVPMRDMSKEEWEVIPEHDRQALVNAGLFSTKKPAAKVEPVTAETPADAPAKGG